MRKTRRQFFRQVGAGAVIIGAGAAGLTLAQAQERTIKVVARKFNFSPNVIELKVNEPVALEFTTADVFMGFNAPDLDDARIDIVPGQTQTLRVIPKKAGTFDFICDVFCGEGHERMGGKLIVTA